MKKKASRSKSNFVLWSAMIAVAATGVIALIDHSGDSWQPLDWWWYVFMLAVFFFMSYNDFIETSNATSYKYRFIRALVWSCVFLLLGVFCYSLGDSGDWWVIPLVFVLGTLLEIREIVVNYREWKALEEESPEEKKSHGK